MITECKRCGACCSVFCIVELTKADKRRIPEFMTESYPLVPGGRMMRADGFVCHELAIVEDKTGCSIYDIRPEVCRKFQPGSELCLKARARYAK